MKWIIAILLGGCLCNGLQAQEIPEHPISKADSTALQMELLVTPPMRITDDWLPKRIVPGARPNRDQLSIMEKRAQQSLIAIPHYTPWNTVQKKAGQWGFSITNVSTNNWSPYPDCRLDARMLRMPLPKNMRPDKRPEHVKRLERLRKTK